MNDAEAVGSQGAVTPDEIISCLLGNDDTNVTTVEFSVGVAKLNLISESDAEFDSDFETKSDFEDVISLRIIQEEWK
jgi:beta-glucanase (GH16 family)